MARKLTKEERRMLGAQVVRLSSRSVDDTRIASQLGINRRTVRSLREEFASEMDPGAEVARAEAAQHYKEIIAACWKKMGDGSKVSPHGMAGLANTALSAQTRLDKLYGIEAPRKVEVEERLSVAEMARRTQGVPPERRLRLVD